MNKEFTLLYLKRVICSFSFQKKLLAWDTFEVYVTEPAKNLLKEIRIDDALIPGRFTKYIQTSNLLFKIPLKGCIIELYDKWIASEMHYYTETRNMKATSRHFIVNWILEAWAQLDKKLIIRSLKLGTLTLKNHGSNDNIICCFK